MKRRRVLMVLGLLSMVGVAPRAHAQYFGRNAVQWERVRFEVLKTTHFDVYHYPEGRAGAELVGRLAERWHARLGRLFDFEMKDRQPIVLYASHPQFQRTHTIGGAPGEGTGGVTEAFKRRIVLPVGASLAETDHVLGHELVHAYQYAMTGQGKGPVEGIGALRMPLWFIEGMAEYLSIGSTDAHTSMWLRDAARREKGLPTIRKLGSAQYFPYRYGHALWAYLGGRFGDQVVAQALRLAGRSEADPEQILKAVTGVDHETLSKEWHAAINEAVGPQLAGRKDPDAYGRALVTEKVEGGRLNVGPALSPDGSQLAFLSERDQLSVELFVQDTRTGKVTQRLSKSLVDPHLESLQFINSSGAWDRAGRLVALGAVAKGRPVLLLLDAQSGRTVREIPMPSLAEIHTPTFSPDGHRVAFSALVEGFTDLFVYDLQAKRLRRLTQDAYADLQPAWSPDGRTIAFVTDRDSTRLDVLQAGDYRLGAVDVATGDLRALPSFARGKNINPQWSPDGSRLYFLSDRTGITNVYALDVASGAHAQITDLQVGVSGITALSPALTAAVAADRLAYSVYVDDRYEIHDIAGSDRLAGWPVGRDEPRRADLIQGAKEGGAVDTARADATTGLADGASPTRVPYKAKLGLDYVGQPSVGAGYGRNGAFFGGGVAMSFSDMLGNHQLGVALEGGTISGFTDIGGAVSYVNRDRRFNWGAQIHQIPYITGSFGSGVSTVSGQAVYLEQTLTQRQLDRGVLAQGFYPFDSALRVEVAAGYRRLGFETRLQSEGFNLRTGQSLFREKETLDGSSLDLGEATVALVRDTSAHGPTAPIAGQRFRLDVSPVFGTIRYTGVLADFRQYASKGKVTVAGRVLHYGRYGASAEDPRMSPLFVGYGSMVRGYDTGSFDVSECGSGGGCPVYEQLLGSRVLVGNAEVRVPLKALFGARRSYGALPVDVGAFADAGVAWDAASSPALFGGQREIVKSVGAVARLNLLGFAVLEFDWVKPLDRPGKRAYFTWNLLAGF